MGAVSSYALAFLVCGEYTLSMTRDSHILSILREITNRLVTGYSPVKVILFGSHAYGEPGEDSDIDLLIIKDTSERFWSRLATVRALTVGTRRTVPFGPIVLTPSEIEQRLLLGDQFIAEILERGVR